jgi:hypothetical protein
MAQTVSIDDDLSRWAAETTYEVKFEEVLLGDRELEEVLDLLAELLLGHLWEGPDGDDADAVLAKSHCDNLRIWGDLRVSNYKQWVGLRCSERPGLARCKI